MNNQKLSSYKTADADLDIDTGHDEEQPTRISLAQLSEQHAQFLVPYDIESAGNRLSPLHEW